MVRYFGCPWPHGVGNGALPHSSGWRSSKGFILFVVMFATFTEILQYGLLLPVTPTALYERVGLSVDYGQKWTSTLLALYSAALLVSSPIAGYISDHTKSRRWPFIGGLVASVISTALLCFGTHIALWIVARIFQGASSAVVWAVGLALICDTVPRSELGQSMGYVGMCMTVGTVAGPLVGGVIYESGGYYSVFALTFGLLGLQIALRLLVDEPKRPTERSLSPILDRQSSSQREGTVGAEASSGPLVTEPRNPAQDNCGPSFTEKPTTRTGSIRGTTIESETDTKPKPTICILLTTGRVLVAVWGFFAIFVLMTSLDSVLPLYVGKIFGWKQACQGLIFLPLAIPHIAEPMVGFINDKYRCVRSYAGAGGFLLSVPVLVLLRIVTYNSLGQKILLCALLSLVGLCIAILMPSFLAEVSYIVQNKEEETPGIFGEGGAMALAYGIMNVACAAGGIAGPFLGGLLREHAGWGVMTWALAVLVGITAILVLLLPARDSFKRRHADG